MSSAEWVRWCSLEDVTSWVCLINTTCILVSVCFSSFTSLVRVLWTYGFLQTGERSILGGVRFGSFGSSAPERHNWPQIRQAPNVGGWAAELGAYNVGWPVTQSVVLLDFRGFIGKAHVNSHVERAKC